MSTKIIDDRDPSVVYTSGWGQAGSSDEYNTTTTYTAGTGSSATVRFSGTGISVFGTITSLESGNGGDPQSAYSVDGGPEFHYIGVEKSNIQYKVQFFQSQTLSPGDHTLVVSFTGQATNTSFSILFLDYFEIAGGGSSSASPSTTPLAPVSPPTPSSAASSAASSALSLSSSSNNPTTTTASRIQGSPISSSLPATVTITSLGGLAASDVPASTSKSQTSPVGAIIGGVLGGLILLAFLAFLLLRYHRKRPPPSGSQILDSNNASTTQVTPFNHTARSELSESPPILATNNSSIPRGFTKFPPVPTRSLHRPGPSQSSTEPSENTSSTYPTGLTATEANSQTSEGTSSPLLSYMSEKDALVNRRQAGTNNNLTSPANPLYDPPPNYNEVR